MTRLTALIALLFAATPAIALNPDPGTEAKHESLRALKAELVETVNAQDFAGLGQLTNTRFTASVVTQDHFTDLDAAKAFFEGLFSRKVLRIETVAFAPEADALSPIYTGTAAVTTGATVETYMLADGRPSKSTGDGPRFPSRRRTAGNSPLSIPARISSATRC